MGTNAQQPNQANNKPVMDVVPPPKTAAAPVPADDLKIPPLMPDDDALAGADKTAEKDQTKRAEPRSLRPVKAPHSGVGLAVAATVIIVLGLAALFVYAYLRTNNISAY